MKMERDSKEEEMEIEKEERKSLGDKLGRGAAESANNRFQDSCKD